MTLPTPAVERVAPPLPLVRIANPVVRRLLASPLHRPLSGHLLLLHVTGRRSGRQYVIPVGYDERDGRLTVLTNSGWRHNLRGGADVELTVRGARVPARATLVEDPERVAAEYLRVIEELGWKPAQRRLGIRITVGRAPTREELADAARRSGLSLVHLQAR